MTTIRFYDKIIARLPQGLEANVLRVLLAHVGAENAISLDELTQTVLDTSNPTSDRQVREAIERLRRRGIPVLSESGRAGRWLAANREELARCVAEMQTRAGTLQQTIAALRRASVPFDEQKPQHQLRIWS